MKMEIRRNTTISENVDVQDPLLPEVDFTEEELSIIDAAQIAGNYLKAPNGEDTLLNPKQWVQVRTSAFKDWFGDWEINPDSASKVLDQNGEPRVMYHGSRSRFNEFDIEKSGRSGKMGNLGFWFTGMESFAQNFAKEILWGNEEHVITYNTFLALKNPKVYDRIDVEKEKELLKQNLTPIREEIQELKDRWKGVDNDWCAYEAFNKAVNNMFHNEEVKEYYANRTLASRDAINDGERLSDLLVQDKLISDKLVELIYSDPYEQLNTDLYKIAGMNAHAANVGGLGMAIDNEKDIIAMFKKDLASNGFDGIIIRGTKYDKHLADGENDQYVVFTSNQIKSAENNIGSFSLNNDDIRYRFIGEKGAANMDKFEEASIRLNNLRVAKEMETSGKSPSSIKMATGWERGADEKWRYEQDDSQITFKFAEQNYGLYNQRIFSGDLKEFIYDYELFHTYPELNDYKICFEDFPDDDGTMGYVNGKEIHLRATTLADFTDIERRNIVNEFKKKYIIHEIQHLIQDIEGFASGNDPIPTIKDIIDFSNIHDEAVLIDSKRKDLEAKEALINNSSSKEDNRATTLEWIDVYKRSRSFQIKTGFKPDVFLAKCSDVDKYALYRYYRASGEVEARNVESRMEMTSEERRNRLAFETEDVIRKDQIFLYDNLGAASFSMKDLQAEIDNISDTLCITIDTINDYSDIESKSVSDLSEKRIAKGWYEPSTGKVVVVLPNVESISDLQATILHEVVAHKGLSGLLGDKLPYMMNHIYTHLPDEERIIIQQNAIDHYKGDTLIATEEYLAEKAEKGVFEPSVWIKIKSAIKDFFRSIGIKLTMKDYELNNLLWKGRESLSKEQTVTVEQKKDPASFSIDHIELPVMNAVHNRQMTEQTLMI